MRERAYLLECVHVCTCMYVEGGFTANGIVRNEQKTGVDGRYWSFEVWSGNAHRI